MKKILLVFIWLFTCKANAQQCTIYATGPTDNCTGVGIQVFNFQNFVNFQWYAGLYDCTSPGNSVLLPYFGPSITVYASGQIYCVAHDSLGFIYLSNPIDVRVLPGTFGSIYMPAPKVTTSGGNCPTSAALCIPGQFYLNWPNTVIHWKLNGNTLSATAPSITVTASGYYQYTITNNCTTSISDSVLVNLAPSVNIASNAVQPLCAGQPVTFNVVSPAPGATYIWQQLINGSYANVGSGNSVTIITPSTASLVVRAQMTAGNCITYSAPVQLSIATINVSLSPAGNAGFCVGDSLLLTGSSNSTGSYQWFKNGVAIPGANTITYAANDSGNYYLKVSNGLYCNGTSPATYVSIFALPSASITSTTPLTFCQGDSAVLTANSGFGFSYQWRKNGININGATSITYTAKSAGNYRVVVTNANGCSKISAAKTITILALPTAVITALGPLSFCAGDSVTLQANVINGATYKWKKYSNFIANATGTSYVAKTTGKYRVEITNSAGCKKLSSPVSVSVICREAGPVVTEPTINVEPNPLYGNANAIVTISSGKIISLRAYAITGQMVEAGILIIDNQHAEVNVQVPGIYILALETEDRSLVCKFVKLD